MKRIILASASPRRRELLEKAGVVFEVMPGNGEERITCKNRRILLKSCLWEKRFLLPETWKKIR